MGCPLSEQLSAGRGELHVCPGLMQMYTRPSRAASVAFAISTSLRAAASGSVKGLGSTNLAGMMSSGRMRDVD
jgi:hypothetical protein